jgi:AraC family transcriptional regulator
MSAPNGRKVSNLALLWAAAGPIWSIAFGGHVEKEGSMDTAGSDSLHARPSEMLSSSRRASAQRHGPVRGVAGRATSGKCVGHPTTACGCSVGGSDGPGCDNTSIKPEYDARPLLHTETVTAWDVVCQGLCRGKSSEEYAPRTRIAFPYHGVYVHSVGCKEHVGEPNQVVIINGGQPYRVSHPVAGGDATLTVGVDPATLLELTPPEYRCPGEQPALNRSGLRIDARTQLLAAQLRQRLSRRTIDPLEAETLALQLIRHTLGDTASHTARRGSGRPEKLADEVKLLLCTDPWRRWTLEGIANVVSVTPVYLTDAFRRVEGVPLYRYHLRLRLAHALHVLSDCDDLTTLAFDLGFNSHSHFSAAFKQTFGQTPSDFKKSLKGRPEALMQVPHPDAKDFDSASVFVSRRVASCS